MTLLNIFKINGSSRILVEVGQVGGFSRKSSDLERYKFMILLCGVNLVMPMGN